MERTVKLSQRRKAETRQGPPPAAAYRVFAQRGYAQATIDDIATAGGVSKGAVYHHFASKKELFRALLADHGHEVDAMVAAIASAKSFRDLVRGFIEIWIGHYREDPLFMPLSLEYRVQATREPWARELVAVFYAQVRALIGGVLRLGQEIRLRPARPSTSPVPRPSSSPPSTARACRRRSIPSSSRSRASRSG